jgi:hypothetical protein
VAPRVTLAMAARVSQAVRENRREPVPIVAGWLLMPIQ